MSKLKAMAIASFAFGLAFWIPLLNLICGALAIYLGIKSLARIRKEPGKYGGKWFAVIGIILGAIVYVTYIIGLGICMSGSKPVCGNIGLKFLE